MPILRITHDFDITRWTVGTDVKFDVNVQYTTEKTDTRADVLADPQYLGHYAMPVTALGTTELYVVESTLEWGGQDANVAWWDSVVTVESRRPEKYDQSDNPLDRPVRRIRVENTRENVASVIDYRGRATTNTAGDYMGGFEIEIPIRKFFFAMNFAALPAWVMFLDGTVNSIEITVLGLVMPPGTARLFIPDFPLEQQFENGVGYYQVAYELHFNPDGWQSLFFSRGFAEFVYIDKFGDRVSPTATPGASAGELYERKKIAILDDAGDPVKQPAFLDSFGRKILKPPMNTDLVGTAVTASGSQFVQPTGFTVVEDDVGKCIGFRNPNTGRVFVTEVLGHGSPFTVKDPVVFSAMADVFLPGVAAISLAKAPYADWSAFGVQF